jgi:hypothetical protein
MSIHRSAGGCIYHTYATITFIVKPIKPAAGLIPELGQKKESRRGFQ